MSILFCNFVPREEEANKALNIKPLTSHVEHKSNLNPKSRKGSEKMTNDYETELKKVVIQAQRDIMYKAMDEIKAKSTQITDLLENGREYMQQAHGDRYQRIYDVRYKLWCKVEAYGKSINCIWEVLKAIN